MWRFPAVGEVVQADIPGLHLLPDQLEQHQVQVAVHILNSQQAGLLLQPVHQLLHQGLLCPVKL